MWVSVFSPYLRENRGCAQYLGKMIDAPVVARAREVLASHDRIAAPEDKSGYNA
jgi:citrate lyase beta subunit